MQLRDAHQSEPGEISRESLVRILEIMDRLAAPEELPELLREIVEVGKIAIVAEAGVLWLHDHAANDLRMVIPSPSAPLRIPLEHGLPGECLRQGIPINSNHARNADLFEPVPDELAELDVRSALTVPIIARNSAVLGVMQWLGTSACQFDHHDEWIAPALAAQAAIAIQHSRLTDKLLADAILHKEVAVAREIQISTLPRRMPELADYDVYGEFKPTDHTGGDLYDLALLDGRLFILLGDATGHGFGPALSATQMQAMLRVAFRLGADLDAAYVQVNNQLAEDLPDDRFITAFVGFLDPASHEVRYHSGGQGPILHYRADSGTCDWHKPTTFPVGAMTIDAAGSSAAIRLGPGDILALLSDGIYEYVNADGGQFGEDRVGRIVHDGRDLPVRELGRQIIDAAFAFGGDAPQLDDITLVLVRRKY